VNREDLFPITAYDRPSMAFANLLTGNPSAAVRAIFAPMTQSPEEIKTIRQRLLQGKAAENPVLRVITDLATNPVLLIGLALAVGPWGKIASPSTMMGIMKEGKGYIKGVMPFMRGFLSSFTNLRELQHTGITLKMMDVTRETHIFLDAWETEVAGVFQKLATGLGRQPTAVDQARISAWLEGFHKAGESALHQYPEYTRMFGGDMALIPGLEQKMGRPVLDAAKDLRQIFTRYGKKVLQDETGEIREELRAKGVEFIDGIYFPRQTGPNRLENWAGGGLQGMTQTWKSFLAQLSGTTKGSAHVKARIGNSLPMQADIDLLKADFAPGVYEKLATIESKQITELRDEFTNIATYMSKYQTEKAQDVGLLMKSHIAKSLKTLTPSENIPTKTARALGVYLEQAGYKDPDVRQKIMREVFRLSLTMGQRPEDLKSAMTALAQKIGGPARYSMQVSKVAAKYGQSMSHTFAWYDHNPGMLEGRGTEINRIISENTAKGSAISNYYEETLRPAMRGLMNAKEYARNLWFKDTIAKTQDWLMRDERLQKALPNSLRKYAIDVLNGSFLSDKTVGGKIAGMAYMSTLGLNLAPISKNLLQNYITTLNVVGPTHLAKGFQYLATRLPEFATLSQKIGVKAATEKLFPDYVRMFGAENLIAGMAEGDLIKEGRVAATAAKNLLTTGKTILMGPFAVSEKFNRLLAFYSARSFGLADKLTPMVKTATGSIPGSANEYAAYMTNMTQFTGGPMGMPWGTAGMWAPLRQFTHFPLRFMEYLYGSLRMGPVPTKMSTGIIGRGLVGSAAAYTVAKDLLHTDISGGLMAGALPGASFEGSAFYPFPFVPPMVGAVGETVKALATGDFGRMGNTAALVVPGGLMARRAYRAFAPKYADYNNRSPDGRIPVYNDRGDLIANETPMQIVMRGLGIQNTDIGAEQQMTQYLLKQRDRIRGMRKDFLRALMANDLEEADKVSKAFEEAYPNLGPLKATKADMRTMENGKEISRLNRVMRGIPQNIRPMFQEMVNQVGLGAMAQNINMSPEDAAGLQHLMPTSVPSPTLVPSPVPAYVPGGQIPSGTFGATLPSVF